jgi:ubiquinone biosynthesis protein UbiJ
MTQIVVVYDADAGVLGEARYLIGKLRGTAKCALCEITHGALGERVAWRECREELGAIALHRNELDADQRAAATELPCVIARDDREWRMILGREEIEACAGRVDALRRAIQKASVRSS